MANDEIGQMAKTDPAIRIIGERRFQAARQKVDMEQESCRAVRAEMRLLATLYIAFGKEENAPLTSDASALFNRMHFQISHSSLT